MIVNHQKWTSQKLMKFAECAGFKQIELAQKLEMRRSTISVWFKVDQNDGQGFNFKNIHCLALDRLLELNDPDGTIKKKIF